MCNGTRRLNNDAKRLIPGIRGLIIANAHEARSVPDRLGTMKEARSLAEYHRVLRNSSTAEVRHD
jgi:hypothetical protein